MSRARPKKVGNVEGDVKVAKVDVFHTLADVEQVFFPVPDRFSKPTEARRGSGTGFAADFLDRLRKSLNRND
jgi:hypothetical protein